MSMIVQFFLYVSDTLLFFFKTPYHLFSKFLHFCLRLKSGKNTLTSNSRYAHFHICTLSIYQFTRAAITNCHKRGNLKQQKLIVSWFWRPESQIKVLSDQFLMQTQKENLLHASPCFWCLVNYCCVAMFYASTFTWFFSLCLLQFGYGLFMYPNGLYARILVTYQCGSV